MSRAAQRAESTQWTRDSAVVRVHDPTGRLSLQLGSEAIPLLQELCRPDGRVFSLWVMGHLIVYAAALLLITGVHSIVALALLSIVVANQLHALTVLQHDCGHGSAYRGALTNLWVGRFLAWFILMPFTTFTVIHRRHHSFLGDPKKDPDEWFYAGGRLVVFLREMCFFPYFTALSLRQFGPEIRQTVLRELVVTIFAWAAAVWWMLASGLTGLLVWGVLVPLAILTTVINPISRGYEHYPMATLTRGDRRRDDLRFNTVTVKSRTLGLMWANIVYHVEHHLYPRVPCHRLPTLHYLLRGRDYLVSPFVLHRLKNL